MKNYITCYKCNFYVTKHDKQCPNCGTIKPWQRGIKLYYKSVNKAKYPPGSPELRSFSLVVLSPIIWVIGGFIVGLFPIATNLPFFQSLLNFFGFVIYIVVGGFVSVVLPVGLYQTVFLILLAIAHKVESNSDQRDSLSKNEQLIHSNLNDNRTLLKKIVNIKEDMTRQPNYPNLSSQLAKWEKYEELINSASRKYTVELWRIETIRWRNSLTPYLIAENLTFEQFGQSIQSLESLREKGKKMLDQWEQQKDVFAIPEANILSSEMKKAMNTLNTEIDNLIAKKSTSLLMKISPARISHNSSNSKSQAIFDVIDLSSSFSDMDSSLEKLEYEHNRIEAELSLL